MRALLRSSLPFVSLVLPLCAQAAPKPLETIDLFRLDYLMQAAMEVPVAFVDAEHWLVFDPGKPSPQGPKSWYLVDAKTGKRELYVARKQIAAALTAQGIADDALSVLDDPEHWTWNADHSRFVLSIADDLFAGRARSGELVRLTNAPGEEKIVQWSPDGTRIGFVRAHDLYVLPADGGAETRLTKDGSDDLFFGILDWVYQEEVYGRGDFRGYWWSPDSKQIALLALDESPVLPFTIVAESPPRPTVEVVHYPKAGEPNPKAKFGLVAATGGDVRWLDLAAYPEDDRLLVRVTWAPDSKDVLLQVTDRRQSWLDMLAFDAATGAQKKLFRETSDCWVEPGPEPVFVRGGAEFLWLSERDGCRHLYRYARDGKELGQLTSGEWQVKKVLTVDDAAGTVWFVGDKASPLQQHLYTLPLAGGEPKQLTTGRGTHDVTLAPGNATFLDACSTAESPERRAWCDANGNELREVAAPQTKLAAPFGLQAPEFVQVKTRDGFPMEAMLFKPRGFEPGKRYPVVQHTYSGPHAPIVRDQWLGRDYLWHQQLAQLGYVVFVCDNRSASGKGRKYAKACFRKLGQSELADLEDSVQWLVEQGIADPQRVGLWGWSYGGYQTLYNLTHSTKWKCGIAVNPCSDWRNYDSIYTERYHGLPLDNEQGYAQSSVLDAVEHLHGNLLLIAAAMDDNVHLQNSLQFLKAMQYAGKDCDLMIYPGVRHGIETLEQQLHLFTRLRRFLQQNL